jgi:NADPH2:quinone reductase
MHLIRQAQRGGPEVLRYVEQPDLQPGPGQVCIAVAAAGVHLVDTTIRSGAASGAFPMPELPMTPGREVAGVVDALGDGVDDSWLGERVTGHLGMASGGYASQALISPDSLHRLPVRVSFPEAVAMIGTGRTVMGVLDVLEGISADDVVGITSAAGGMGTLLVQAARNAGAFVVGVAGGPEKGQLVKDLGADVVADRKAEGWQERLAEALGERRLTVLLDGAGGDSGRALFELLGPGGRVVVYGYSAGEPLQVETSDLVAKAARFTWALGPWMFKRHDMRGLEALSMAALAAGELVPPPPTTFPLADAAEAHRALEAGETTGKVVLLP